MKRLLVLWSVLVCLLAGSWSLADEGMWLYNRFPKDKVKIKYGFEPSEQWLDHLRLSSVRFSSGGSGSFVSSNGLVFTNHHVGADCIHELSSGGKDYMKSGFYAPTLAQEIRCSSLEVDQLVGIEEVTSKINAEVKPGMVAGEASQRQRLTMASVEKECAATTGLRCDVVALYSGKIYDLYRYKKYTDVRLVFAPEFDAAFFGGDLDNFTYPRYDLDICFFRAYENGQPARVDNYLHWSKTGVKEGDLVFVSGNPGSTGRLLTLAQLEFLRDVEFPSRLDRYAHRLPDLKKFIAASAENAHIAEEVLFGHQNGKKAITGYEAALRNKELMAHKAATEQKLRAAVHSNPKTKKEIGDPWSAIAHAMEVEREIYPRLTYVEWRPRGFTSELANMARQLVRVAEEKTKPNGERLQGYRDSALPSLERQLLSSAPIYKSLEALLLGENFAEMQRALGKDDPVVLKVLAGKSPEEAAKSIIEGTQLDDVAVRKRLYQGGEGAIELSKDPLIVLMRSIDSEARAVRKRYEDEVEAVERIEGPKVALALFSEHESAEPPDATSTLRLSYGTVKGYVENGNRIPYHTSLRGAYKHAAEHDNKPPFQLPDSWMKSKSKLALATPLNFVSTADIIGGNSGSPTVNEAGEVVGIIFDGNIQMLTSNFFYSDRVGRAVSVDVRGIQEALRNIYGATGLANELMGRARAGSAPKSTRVVKRTREAQASPVPRW
jgi:hypothetical protein